MAGTLLASPKLHDTAFCLEKDVEYMPTSSTKVDKVDVEAAAAHRHAEAAALLKHDFGKGSSCILDRKTDAELEETTLAQLGFSHRYRVGQRVIVLVMVLFVFLQPFWSWLFNDHFGLAKTLCHTPAEHITCGNGEDYVGIARRLGRVDAQGRLVGCACENGIFADWACATNTDRFSISYFISTAPGTGTMAAITFWPIIDQWLQGAGFYADACRQRHQASPKVEGVLVALLQATQVSFQFFYGLFLINTVCVGGTTHTIVVVLFILSLIVHFIVLFIAVGAQTKTGKMIQILATIGIVSLVTGCVWPVGPSWLGQHAFWLGECISLTCVFSAVPMISCLT